MILRDYQNEALFTILNAYNNGVKNQLLKLCTGGGKTVIFSSILDYTGWPGKQLVLVHREELVYQAVDKIKQLNPGKLCMIEMAGDSPWIEYCDFVVASIQSISRDNRLLKYNPREFSIVVVDEAHHATANSYRKVLEYFRNGNLSSLRLGVTATPNRADGKGLGELFDEIVFSYGIREGIRDGWLVDLVCKQVKTTTDLDKVKSSYGDLNLTDLDLIANTPTRNIEIVNGWKEFGNNQPTVLYGIDVKHSISLAKAFHDEGVPSDYVFGGDVNRAEKLKRHQQGDFKILANCEVLTEGYDDWSIGCIAMARPTKSESLYTQMVGRGTRIDPLVGNMNTPKTKPRKTECIVLDYTDNCTKHNLVSLANLFGIPSNVNIDGKKITYVAQKLDKVKEQYPTLDLKDFNDDIEKLEVYAQSVDLFKVKFTEEVEEYSKFKWYKVNDGYVLLLANKEGLNIKQDQILDKYLVEGKVSNKSIHEYTDNLQHAFMLADGYVNQSGLTSLVKRKAKWHQDEPTLKQLKACKALGIKVPEGASKGEVHSKISQVMAERKNKV